MSMDCAAATDVGRKRKRNEDACLCEPDIGLFVAADGMGGAAAGDLASAEATRVIAQQVRELHEALLELNRGGDMWQVHAVLETALQDANDAICRLVEEDHDLQGMGTTASLLWICGNHATVAHVGDSRVYLVRDGLEHILTEDHSVLRELIKQGQITAEEAEDFPCQTAISRKLGNEDGVEVDTLDIELISGDRFLICSDGLHRYLKDGEVAELLAAGPAEQIAKGLVDLANERGGADNITAVVVSVPEIDTACEARRKIEIFEGMPLFHDLTHKEVLTVLSATTMRHFQPEQVIFEEGVLGDELFVILTGEVEVSNKGIVLATLGEGDGFGEMALVDHSPRSATVVAKAPTRMLVLTRDRLYDVMARRPALATKLLWNFLQVTIERLRTASEQVTCLTREQRTASSPPKTRSVPRKLVIRMPQS